MTDQETAGHTFNRWLTSEIKPFLGARGWRKRGATFELPLAPNTALIAFRRSKWSDASKYEFFVEAGVFSPRLADDDATFAGLPPPTRPTLDLGAVSARLSSLMGEQQTCSGRSAHQQCRSNSTR